MKGAHNAKKDGRYPGLVKDRSKRDTEIVGPLWPVTPRPPQIDLTASLKGQVTSFVVGRKLGSSGRE